MSQHTNRRRSSSMTTYSESTSLYNTFISRFKQPSNINVIPSKSVSLVTSTHNRKPAPPNSPRKKYEAVLGVKAEDLFSENASKKTKFGSLFRKKNKIPLDNLNDSLTYTDDSTQQDNTSSRLSTRKSTGSNSIYSTFGPESIYGENESNVSEKVNNTIEEEEEEDSDDDDDEKNTPEDIATEKTEKLSKRLSGGHFGSAGGLLLSIEKRTPEDVMINWNRRSDQSLSHDVPKQQSNNPIRHAAPTRALPPHPVTEENNKMDPKECATRLWHEDDSFVQREQIAEWLGQSKPLNIDTLQEYMEFFDFSKMRLDNAFRKVCSKLYFRAEAQQIDRILEAFAKQYWQCNPKSILGSADIVYAVVYSLMLLNTDLHVAQGTHTRMTRHEFVKNTMSTIHDQKKIELKTSPKSENYMIVWETRIESYLKDLYISVKSNQILQPRQNELDPAINKRMSVMAGKRMIRSLNTMIHKSGSTRESMLFQDDPTMPRKSTSSANYTPRESFTSNYSIPTPKSIHSSLLSPAPTTNNTPYTKEGIVMRKHLLESKNQKARHREWRECLLVVRQGEFKMYGLPYDGDTPKLYKGSTSFSSLADSLSKGKDTSSILSNENGPHTTNSKWVLYSQLIGTVELNHTLSNALPPPGYNRSKPYVFALQEPNGGVYLIQSNSHEQVNEWVETCNYWAARQSKEPLQGGVGNIEYGWGNCLNDVILDLDSVEHGDKITGDYINNPDNINVSTWMPPAPSMVASILDEEDQLESMQRYVDQLNEEINDHREIKKKILVKFQHKSQNQSRVLANWEAKSTYMLHEIIKYQNYCNALEKSIKERT